MTQQIPKSAAASLYPHLQTGTPAVVERRRGPASVGAAMWPGLGPQPKPPTNWHRELLLKNLRELNARLRANK
jgi:hypothetical protein